MLRVCVRYPVPPDPSLLSCYPACPFSRGKGSPLLVWWVRYLGNQPNPSGFPWEQGSWFIFWLKEEAESFSGESLPVPSSWLGVGIRAILFAWHNTQAASVVEAGIIIQNDQLLK